MTDNTGKCRPHGYAPLTAEPGIESLKMPAEQAFLVENEELSPGNRGGVCTAFCNAGALSPRGFGDLDLNPQFDLGEHLIESRVSRTHFQFGRGSA